MAQEMEPAPEGEVGGDTVLICGEVFGVGATAVELSEVGEIGKDEISGLEQLVNLRTLVVKRSRFSDDGWAELLRILRLLPLTTLELSDCGLGPRHAADLAELFRGAMAVLARLDCSQNDAITGKRSRDNDGAAPWIYGEQPDGWIALCSSLSGSSITSLNFSGCGLKPESLTPLADAIKLMAVVARISVLSNPIGVEGAAALIEVYEKNPQIRTLLGIEEGVTDVNFSEKNVDVGQTNTAIPGLIPYSTALDSRTIAG
jgi:hypothetical protein